MIIDLQDARCPNAQVKLNPILELFLARDEEELTIFSIEPSLERALRQRITHMGYPLDLVSIKKTKLTPKITTGWDKEDYEDVEHQTKYFIKLSPQP